MLPQTSLVIPCDLSTARGHDTWVVSVKYCADALGQRTYRWVKAMRGKD